MKIIRPMTPLGPNLAKGDFLANYSRSEVKIGEESGCHADEHAQNGAQGGRKVRIMRRLRSFDRPSGANPDARAAELRKTAWLNRNNELLVHAPVSLGNRLLSPTAKNGMKLIDQRSPFSFNRSSPHRLPVQCLHREEDRSSNTALLCAAHVHTLSYSIRA